MNTFIIRFLKQIEIDLIKAIDRSEEILGIYKFDAGKLCLFQVRESLQGFDKTELALIVERQYKIFAGGGKIIGAFYKDKLIGIGSIENKKRGINFDYCKLDILYISRYYRRLNIGKKILKKCQLEAKLIEAKKLYISATPSMNTIDFYL